MGISCACNANGGLQDCPTFGVSALRMPSVCEAVAVLVMGPSFCYLSTLFFYPAWTEIIRAGHFDSFGLQSPEEFIVVHVVLCRCKKSMCRSLPIQSYSYMWHARRLKLLCT